MFHPRGRATLGPGEWGRFRGGLSLGERDSASQPVPRSGRPCAWSCRWLGVGGESRVYLGQALEGRRERGGRERAPRAWLGFWVGGESPVTKQNREGTTSKVPSAAGRLLSTQSFSLDKIAAPEVWTAIGGRMSCGRGEALRAQEPGRPAWPVF